MPACCAPGCRSGYTSARASSVRRHFFKPSNDAEVLKAWTNAIPRKDFKVTPKTYVCDIHFNAADIVSCYEHVVNGETVTIPRGRWTLREGAVPRIFPNTPQDLSERKASKAPRKRTKVRTVVSPKVSTCQSDEDLCDEVSSSDGMDGGDCADVNVYGYKLEAVPWLPAMQDCTTFESWHVQASTDHVIFYKLEESRGIVLIEKAVVVRQDWTVEVSSRGALVPRCSYIKRSGSKQIQLTSLKNVATFLCYINSLEVCTGCKCELFPGISTSTTAVDTNGVCRSKECMVLSGQNLCPPCRKILKIE